LRLALFKLECRMNRKVGDTRTFLPALKLRRIAATSYIETYFIM